jgi:DNA polymerase-3 subunit delta'
VNFRSFLGNPEAVRQLQEMLASDRLPHALILAGGRGAGKYSLALALTQTIHCLQPQQFHGLPDACDVCTNCVCIAAASDLETRVAEAVEAREQLRDADRKDTRILIQPHPDVLILPPDPPQLLVKVGQVRSLIHNIQRLPAEGRRKLYIFSKAAFMNEAANSLLKVLEEPPPYAHILLLSENPNDLLPTMRSRASVLRLHPMPLPQLEEILAAQHAEWKPKQRALVARLAEGTVGRALSFNVEAYAATRKDALLLLRTALAEPDHSALFRTTESYRAGSEGQHKTQELLRALYSLLEDMLLLQAGAHGRVRNIDIETELRQLAAEVRFEWIEQATRAIGQVESGMRRNLLRSLSLDALTSQLSQRT